MTLATRLRLAALVVVAATAVAACGSSSSPSSTSAAAAAGGSGGSSTSSGGGKTYIIATSADFPPMSSRSPSNPNQIIGFEPDIMKAIMGHLGLKYRYVTSDFDGLIPSVQSGRADMVVSDIYDTSARRKIVSFVDYLQHAFAIMVPSASASKIRSSLDLCGKSVGILTGSAPETAAVQSLSKQCTRAGKPAVSSRSFPEVAQELPPLGNNTLQAMLETDVTESHISQQTHGRFKVVFGLPSTETRVGIVVAKNSPLKSKLQSAVNWLIASPTYKSAAQKWGLPASNLLASK